VALQKESQFNKLQDRRKTHLQRRGAQWFHFIALSKHIVTAKVAEHERVAAVEQVKAKNTDTARP
jgi:hypothetical protein